MPGQKLRWLTAALFASAGAGMLSLTSMMNPAFAFGEPDPDIGLFVGASGTPIPGPDYVGAAYELYVDPTYPGAITSFYQGTTANPLGNGVFTPEGLYPLESAGAHQLYLNYPLDPNGLPDISSSVGQGATIVQSTVLGEQAVGDASTVFGYSQGSTLNGIAMQLLDPSGTPQTDPLDPQFLLIADPSNPNGGLLERFNGFETTSGQTVSDPLNLPSLGISFDGATPSDDYTTSVYTLEYDGFADFPRYPLNFFSDLNAFLGIADLHGTYLNAAAGEAGPTPTDIANAILLPGSADYGTGNPDSLTDYYMMDTLGGEPVTAPLVGLLPTQLQELLGPDLTYLINLGYGDGSLGYSDAPADVATPFGLAPDVSLSTVLSTLSTDTEQGIQNLMSGTDPYASAAVETASSGQSLTDLVTALEADAANPAASLTDFVNALSSAGSTLSGMFLSLTDITNALLTSAPSYELGLFTANIATGDYADAFGLPIAADTALNTLSAGFAYEVINTALTQISADFSGLF
jgi:PE-PPE domain